MCAVVVSGDKDFIPAMQATRKKGKRVAVCSFKNSINRDLLRRDMNMKDFEIIWLDDFLDRLVVAKSFGMCLYQCV